MFTHSQVVWVFFPSSQTSVSKFLSGALHYRVKTAYRHHWQIISGGISALWMGYCGLSKLLKERQRRQERSVKYCPCTHSPGRAAQKSYPFSWQEPTLGYDTVSLQNFKLCQQARHPWYPQWTWKEMSVCTLSPTRFGNLNFGNLFCTELEGDSSFKMRFSSFFVILLTLQLWGLVLAVCSHNKIAEKSFLYVCKPWQNALQL